METPSSIGQFLTYSPFTGDHLEGRGIPASATIHFEVAPDPSDLSLTADWRWLSIESRQEITQRISTLITPGVLRALESHGRQLQGWGGYKGETNPSVAIMLSMLSAVEGCCGCALRLLPRKA
jgi:hypothetical protein